MRRRIYAGVFFTVITLFFIFPARLFAARRVVNEADIEASEGCAVIMVRFNFPVRYMRHFPKEPSGEVRIQFEPISMSPSDLENRFEREDVRFSSDGAVPLTDIIFEGNITGGPFLTLTFQTKLSFDVKQGVDFRSLAITPYQDGERAKCFPAD